MSPIMDANIFIHHTIFGPDVKISKRNGDISSPDHGGSICCLSSNAA